MPTSAKKRILVASEPGIAGVKRHIIDYLGQINLESFDIIFVYSLVRSDAVYVGQLKELEQRGICLRQLRMTGNISPWADWCALLGAIRLVIRHRPDIIHAHSSKAGFLFRMAAWLTRSRARIIYTPHAMSCYFSSFFQWIEQVLASITDLILAVSPSERQDILDWKITSPDRVRAVAMGVDMKLSPVRPGRQYLVAACGRISYQKNTLLFVRAFNLVAAQRPDVIFRWIGSYSDDRESQAVKEALAQSPDCDRFEITGWVDDPDTLLAEAAVFCILSRYEAFGYVTADAMLLKIPVVGLDVSGIRDLVQHGKTGLLVEADPRMIAEAILYMLDHPEIGEKWGETGRNVIQEQHSVSQMVLEIEAIYQELLSSPKLS